MGKSNRDVKNIDIESHIYVFNANLKTLAPVLNLLVEIESTFCYLDTVIQLDLTFSKSQTQLKRIWFLQSCQVEPYFLNQLCQDITTLDSTRGKVESNTTTEMVWECKKKFHLLDINIKNYISKQLWFWTYSTSN